MVMLFSLLFRWQLVATGDVMLRYDEMAVGRRVMLCSLILRWQLVSGGDVM